MWDTLEARFVQGLEISERVACQNPTSTYLERVAGIPIIPIDQQIFVTQIIKAGNDVRSLLSNSAAMALLSADTQIELRRLAACAAACRDHLTKANARLVANIARRFLGRGLDFETLMQLGNEGLLVAMEKFEPERGNRFSTYATWWIRQKISRGVIDLGREIRIPVNQNDRLIAIERIRRHLTQVLGRHPTDEELAQELYMEPVKLRELLNISRPPLSLDDPLVGRNSRRAVEPDDTTLEDQIADRSTGGQNPEDLIVNSEYTQIVNELLARLPERTRRIMRRRYLDETAEGGEITLEEIGLMERVTRERIRQIESDALSKLRTYVRARPKYRKLLGGI